MAETHEESLKRPKKDREPKRLEVHLHDKTSKKKGKEKLRENQTDLLQSGSTKIKKKRSYPDDQPAQGHGRDAEAPDCPSKRTKRVRHAVPSSSDVPKNISGDDESRDGNGDVENVMHRQAKDLQNTEGKAPGVSPASGMKKTKKRKRLSVETADHGRAADGPRLKENDHRDNDSTFPDPSRDESLTDQNRRALAYVYERFHRPSSWKFNKARQNWLIRNIWSEQAIPEKYFPLLQRYLIDTKGGIRQRIVDSCNLKVSQPCPPSEDTASQPINPTVFRARLLLAGLSETS